MKVKQLYQKFVPGEPTTECSVLSLRAGVGIENDIQAQVGSPRQILLVSQRTLSEFQVNPGALRENLLVDDSIAGFKSGQVLQIGLDALVRLTFHCEPCKNLEKIQPGLMQRIKTQRGFLGMIVNSGRIVLGDEIVLTSSQFPALGDTAKARFWEFVPRIPEGKVVKTADLLLALGVSAAYYRAIPGFLKQAVHELPIHRIIKVDGGLLTRYIPDQAEQLVAEGIKLDQARVTNPNYFWAPQNFHELGLSLNLP
ncbi:MAG: MOSC domain-containing protein [Microcoleaceae cyanobacterium]